MTDRRRTDRIVIHCADTPAHMDIGAEEIRAWHRLRGFSDVGYHFVIRRNGEVERGRPENAVGAHVQGWNSRSVGICLVGGKPEANFTPAQWESLERLVRDLQRRYPAAEVAGHRDLNSGKRCPCFDVRVWLDGFPGERT